MIAVTRNQRKLLPAYIFSAALVFVTAPVLVQRLEMTGAILASILSLGSLDVLLGAIMAGVLRKRAAAQKK